MHDYLPISRADMNIRGWKQCDFIYVTGDAYVDHPSFGSAIITRVLESRGYRVGIISQPDWKDNKSIQVLGQPRLGFLVSAGNMDSMVNHYSVSKKKREKDAYTPGGVMGKRPDYATIVYGNLIRTVYKETPIIIGGIEASLRRLAHYDYWSNQLKRSILLDAQADLISYGMGEKSIVEIAEALDSGIDIRDITFIDGTVFKSKTIDYIYEYKLLPTFQELKSNKRNYAKSFHIQNSNTDPITGMRLVEAYGTQGYVIQNPPAKPLTTQEMDDVYDLNYMRGYHPSYEESGGVPAISEIKFSLISNRGCFGSCNFCALTFHQGRIIQSRSHTSLIEEAKMLIMEPDFKGYIHDVGGPTANFRAPACKKQETHGACSNKQCLFPQPCKNLEADHSDYIKLLRKLRELPKVKKVFIRSGIRFDYLLADNSSGFLKELCEHHVSGQLKVAPEHVANNVLKRMGKPNSSVYKKFSQEFKQMNGRLKKEQYLVPYLMSSHPGSTLNEAIELAEYLRDLGYMPEQVQDFYPTPSTASTCMYYTGLNPDNLEEVYVPINPHEKAMQRALIQYRNPRNFDLVIEALKKAGRTDLIGFEKHCLIRPRYKEQTNSYHKGNSQSKESKPDRKKKKTIRNLHKKKS